METTFNYCVLRLVPDDTRGEVINVGLVVFRPGDLDVRVVPELAKIRALNPNVDSAILRDLPRGLNLLVPTDADVEMRHAQLENLPLVRATKLGWFQCRLEDYEGSVQRLMERLVLTPRAPAQRRPTRLETTIKDALRKSNLLGTSEQIDSHLVVPHFPIAPAEALSADFALKNGRMHFTAAIDLGGSEATVRHDKRGQAALKAMTLNRAKERFPGCARIVVFTAPSKLRELLEPHLLMLKHDADHLIDFGDKRDRATFIDYMQSNSRN